MYGGLFAVFKLHYLMTKVGDNVVHLHTKLDSWVIGKICRLLENGTLSLSNKIVKLPKQKWKKAFYKSFDEIPF